MGLKPAGLRGSLRNISQVNVLPDSDVNQYLHEEGSGTSLNDSAGSIDASLVGGDWTSSPLGGFDHATTYNGVDNHWITDSPIPVNGQEYAVWMWVNNKGGGDSDGRVIATTDNTSLPSDGWLSFWRDASDVNAGEFVHLHVSGGSTSTSTIGVLPLNEPIFIGLTADGDNYNAYVYDTTEQIATDSATLTRAATGDKYIRAMSVDSAVEGDWHASGFSDQTYSEQMFEDIWEATR